MEINRITELTDFIEQSPTAFHAVQNLKTMLDKDGFQELKEAEKWHLEPDGKYYVTRNNSSDGIPQRFTDIQIKRKYRDKCRWKVYRAQHRRIRRYDLFYMVRQTAFVGRPCYGKRWKQY